MDPGPAHGGGPVGLRRRHVPTSPLLALVVIVLVAVAISYGPQRFRARAEPAVVVLAAIAIDAGLRRVRARRNSIDTP